MEYAETSNFSENTQINQLNLGQKNVLKLMMTHVE